MNVNSLNLKNIAKPISYAFLEVSQAFADSITTPSGVKLFLDPSFNKAEHSTVVGKIAALPQSNKKHQRIVNQLNVGDEVCFSFRVCSDVEPIITDGYFTQITSDEDKYVRRWQNGKQETITKVAFPGKAGFPLWIGSLVDATGEPISGVTGSESDVDRWQSQFSFSQEDKYKFKNLIDLGDGQSPVWKVRMQEIFAKKTDEGLVAVGDRILCKPVDVDVKKRIEILKGIALPQQSVLARYYDRSEALHDYEPLGIKKGDIVAHEERYVERYTFYDKEYFILKAGRIIGRWEKKSQLKLVS